MNKICDVIINVPVWNYDLGAYMGTSWQQGQWMEVEGEGMCINWHGYPGWN